MLSQNPFHKSAMALVIALILPWAAIGDQKEDADYDRLDGTGKSRKKVNVIEWEGNLEVHVYPEGSLKGLALKLDDRTQGKTVMVIGYRFDAAPQQQLIRRAILGIPLKAPFRVYRDTSAQGYDKLVITNHTLGASYMAAFKLDPEPKQLYPDGHPALLADEAKAKDEARAPAGAPEHQAGTVDDETGTIKPFKW